MDRPEITQIAEGVRVARVAYPDFDVRATLLLGSSRALVFDTLFRPSQMESFADLIGDRELITVYSHADWDHVWGTAGLPDSGGEVVGHVECARRFEAEVPRTLAAKIADTPGEFDEVALIAPSVVFEDRMRIDVEPWTVDLVSLPGHTPDSVVAWVPELGLLLGGDAIEDPWPFPGKGLPIEPWIASLEQWAEEPRLKTVVPSHGPISDRSLIDRNIEYLRSVLDGTEYRAPEGTGTYYLENSAAAIEPPSNHS